MGAGSSALDLERRGDPSGAAAGPPGVVGGISRRVFLEEVGAAAALGGLALAGPCALARGREPDQVRADPWQGKPLRLQPVLTHGLPQRQEMTSWRPYGSLMTEADVDRECERIGGELRQMTAEAEFPIDVQPLVRILSDADLAAARDADCDAVLVYGAGGAQGWIESLAASGKPVILFVRHRSGPFYLWYEIAHWRLLRKSEDAMAEPHITIHDVVVDEYAELLWRLRALFGLRNARGTKMLAIGGLRAYSRPSQELGPKHAQQSWGYTLEEISEAEFGKRLQAARADESVMRRVNEQTDQLLGEPNVELKTDRRAVVNSFLAWRVVRQLLEEKGATNFGFANCMGGAIRLLDTPPCLVLSLANDAGYTAFCHTDLTHTVAGVLLRWISLKPSFVCNSHFPHDGLFTVAHCAAPRKMNGKTNEPTAIMTHFESDYGAATKVDYPKGQVVTVLVPNLHCTKWAGFRGTIVGSPSFDACRSQMEIEVEGDWQRLAAEMEGFHVLVCYGDYLREVGYALRKLGGIEWVNYSGSGSRTG